MIQASRRRAIERRKARYPTDQALYTAYRQDLWQRCQGRCERPGCGRMAEDAHHTRKPRQSNHAYLVALCRTCHQWVDAPDIGPRGRLRIAGTTDHGMITYRFRWREGDLERSVLDRTVLLRRLSPPEEEQ